MNPATREAKTPWSSGDEDPLWLLTLAQYYGIDLGRAVREKFNYVSEREGFPERL